MTKLEEKAEEYFCEHCENSFEHDNGHCSNCSKWDYFIAGFAEGWKEKWHDLRKNPNDLPNNNREVLVLLWNYDDYYIGHYERYYDDVIRENIYWHFSDFGITENKLDSVLAWCELPQFEE